MTDLVTIDLHGIFRTTRQLAKLHEIQRARLAERSITGGARPHGMRLSTADPIRRVKAAFDPFWNVRLDEGMSERGYLAEDLTEVALFHGEYAVLGGKSYAAQVPVQWSEHGQTAHDFVVFDHLAGDYVISIKSSINDTKPSKANLDQERRMLALGGYPAGTTWGTWMVNPSTLRAVGPHEETLTQEDIDAAKAEFSRVTTAYNYFAAKESPTDDPAWNDSSAWWEMFGLRSTSGAFRFDTLDASAPIEKRARGFVNARRARKAAELAEETAKKLIRPHIEEQLALARETNPKVKHVISRGAGVDIKFSVQANGVLRVDEAPAAASEVAA